MTGLPRPSLALGDQSKVSHLGLKHEDRPVDPTESFWLAPLLHVLAEKAFYRPRVFFAGDNALKAEVIRAAGYDPEKPATLPRPLEGSKPQGLHRVIYYAAFYARGDIARRAPIPLVVFRKGPGKTAEWALTEAGIAVAAEYRPAFARDGRNVTNVWLSGQITYHNLYNRLVEGITHDPTTRKERETGEVLDHVQTFMDTRIRCDSFASRLATCDPPTFRELKTYCLRSTYTTFKRRAQDPLHREGRGALTDAERRSGALTTKGMVASEYVQILQPTDGDTNPDTATKVLVDRDQHDRDQHRLEFERGMDKVREAFRRFKPGNADRISRIFTYMAEGRTVQDIGDLEGVSRNRAATLMADTRQALRAARQASVDAVTVLHYLSENPCSTLDDLTNDLTTASGFAKYRNDNDDTAVATRVTTPLSTLLDGLVEHNRLKAERFTSRGGGTVTGYLITDRGHSFLAERAGPNPLASGLIESLCL